MYFLKEHPILMRKYIYNLKAHLFLIFLVVVLPFIGCKQQKTKVTRGFYLWQSDYSKEYIKNQENFKSFNGERLYLKMFEVAYDDQEGAIPVSKTNIKLFDQFLQGADLVPCVFVENSVMKKLTKKQLHELADNILFLVNKYVQEEIYDNTSKPRKYNEIQIDCDWSVSTRDNYFELLKIIKEKSTKTVSCTMRLYPYKYQEEMGVPPVDRIMLLCYNLLNPTKNTEKNTILEIEELKKYIDFETPYPVPVDVALPVYSTGYRFQNQRFQGVFHAVPKELEEILIPLDLKHHYVVSKDTFINGYFDKGEKLKIERVSESTLIEAAELLSDHIDQKEMNVVLYHLDHNELKQYDHEILDSVYTIFE